MGLVLFLRGVLVGFLAAVPIGPVNVLCIQRTLSRGRAAGLVSGLGAATVDACYGGAAGLGLSLASNTIIRYEELFRFSGGLFILFLGIRTILARPRTLPGKEDAAGLPGAYFSTLVLTLANPTTIFSYGLLFAGLGTMHGLYGKEAAALLVPGVFIGSTLWWIVLSFIMGVLRHPMNAFDLKWVNRIAGAIVAGFGLFILLRPY